MPTLQTIVPCLWFDRQAEEAANFYISVFPESRVVEMTRYGEAGHDVHGMPAGTVLTVDFELAGQRFTALNGGPAFQFNEAVSLQIMCEDQDEIDHYWDLLTAGGDPNAQQCGWLKDRFGLSWQVTPRIMARLINDPDKEKAARAMTAMLQMKKIVIADLEQAVEV